MIDISVTDYNMLIAFWLSFSRWSGVVFQLPIFDQGAIPSILKVLVSLIISFAFFPFVQTGIYQEVVSVGAEHFWALTFFHTIVGLIIGFLVKSIMSIFVSAGSIMTQQIGFSSVTYFDPTFVSQIGPFERIIQWTVLVMILSTGALLPMFKGVLTSFQTITYLDFSKFSNTHIFYQNFFKGVFSSAFLLSTPILFTNLLLNLVMGIVAKTIPQMNILMVSFVVNIGVGLLVFLAISNEFFSVAYKMYVDKLGEWFLFIT